MTFELTQKDKKLLTFLSIFVVVVCIGYWGILPNVKKIMENKDMIEQAEIDRGDIDAKIAETPLIQADNKKLQKDIVSAREQYFTMMSASEIDHYFTDMGLKYNLYRYDLSIVLPEELANLEPYQYSEKALNPQEEEEEDLEDPNITLNDSESSQIEAIDEASGEEDEDALEEEVIDTGMYTAVVTLRLGGDRKDLQRLINDLSNSKQKLRVCEYNYEMQRGVVLDPDGGYNLEEDSILVVKVEIYMCEEFEYGYNE